MVRCLTPEQRNSFREDGFIVLENALTPEQLTALNTAFSAWVEESRKHTAAYGETLDGRPRFDVEPGHCAAGPALRRVASPIEISRCYLDAMRAHNALDAVAELIGPNVKFNNSKVNSKLPGAKTEVKYHQDFMFEPHTNDDLMAVLFFLDEVTAENGPLEVVPGSHCGPLYDHWHDGVFTGSVARDVEAAVRPRAQKCTGPAGAACLMHTRLLHGSAPNLSDKSRTLFVAEYCAEDAQPLVPNHIPSRYDGEIVRGRRTNRVRSVAFEMAIPEYPKDASFFSQQAKHL